MADAAFPTADEIATAIVAAARLTGEDPVACVQAAPGLHCRLFAFDALCSVFPEASRLPLARCVGFAKPRSYSGSLASAKLRAWWSDDHVDEVVGALCDDEPRRGRAEMWEDSPPAPRGGRIDCAYCPDKTAVTVLGVSQRGDVRRQRVRCGCPKGRTWQRNLVSAGRASDD